VKVRNHFAAITTPFGSVVTVTGLTAREAQAIARKAASEPYRRVKPAEGEEVEECPHCDGQGGELVKVSTRTVRGSAIVTDKWVSCKPCAGRGIAK
jgi:hypothetical protein